MTIPDGSKDREHIRVRSNRPGWVSLIVSPALESREVIGRLFRPHLEGLPEELTEALLLAVDELIGNAMEHGCHLEPNRCVEVALIRSQRMVLMWVRDDGDGFSIQSLQHAAVSNPPNEPLRHTELRTQLGLRPGGFGIMLATKVADELLYNQHGNSVMLIKYLDCGSGSASDQGEPAR